MIVCKLLLIESFILYGTKFQLYFNNEMNAAAAHLTKYTVHCLVNTSFEEFTSRMLNRIGREEGVT